MDNVDVFMLEYKKVEGILRDKFGISYLKFEEAVAVPSVRSKLQLCRIMRNYIAHEGDGHTFVAPSINQIVFLRDLYSFLFRSRR